MGKNYRVEDNLTETEVNTVETATEEISNETEEITESVTALPDGESETVTDESEPSPGGENEPADTPTAEDEISALTAEHPELTEAMEGLNMERYADLRAMGLTVNEAYLAASRPKVTVGGTSHLSDSMPRGKRGSDNAIPPSELREVRRIFEGMSDSELHKLYKKVTR